MNKSSIEDDLEITYDSYDDIFELANQILKEVKAKKKISLALAIARAGAYLSNK